jgi:hypothetical protein
LAAKTTSSASLSHDHPPLFEDRRSRNQHRLDVNLGASAIFGQTAAKCPKRTFPQAPDYQRSYD